MIFGRKKKSAAKDKPLRDEAGGVIRRGLAETTGRLPSERVASKPRLEGANPYNSIGRAAKRTPLASRARPGQEVSSYEGRDNPYDNATTVPAKNKRGWDEIPIGRTGRR